MDQARTGDHRNGEKRSETSGHQWHSLSGLEAAT
jgi:hypothetical protein